MSALTPGLIGQGSPCNADSQTYDNKMNWVSNSDFNMSSGPCQLVTAANACLYLRDKIPWASESAKETLVDIVGCRHGSAISIHKAWKIFKIVAEPIVQDLSEIKRCLLQGRPVELASFAPEFGYHSSLIICVKSNILTVINYSKDIISEVRWEDIKLPGSHWDNVYGNAFNLI